MRKHSHQRFRSAGWRNLAAGLLLALFSVLPAAGQGQTATVRTDPAVLEFGQGEVAVVSIVLAGVRDAYGIDVRAAFDPQLVEVVDADPGSEGVQMAPGSFLKPDFVARNTADNAAGSLRYAATQVNPTGPATGTGVVLAIQLRARSPGETSLALGPVELADRQGQLIPVTVEPGTIRVVAAQAAAVPNAEPAAAPGPQPLPSVLPGGLPCASSALLPAFGLLALARWSATRRGRD